jgi:predicted enzyme related to lactoylglutathione lyase
MLGAVSAARLSHAMVFVSDLEAMVAFYGGAFGLRREDSADAGFVFMRGSEGADVALHLLPPQHRDSVAPGQPPVWREDTAIKLCFRTDALARQRQAILDHGGEARPPWSWQGIDFCECTDPEGNVLQLWQPQPA